MSEQSTDATAQSEYDGPIEVSEYEATSYDRCRICGRRTKHVQREGDWRCIEDHTTTDEGQQTLLPDGGGEETDAERRERLSKVRNAPDPMPLAEAKRTGEQSSTATEQGGDSA
jgi:hypothetical protein